SCFPTGSCSCVLLCLFFGGVGMPKRPKSPESDHPKVKGCPEESGRKQGGLGRRDFVKLVGGTGVAVTAGVLTKEVLLPAESNAQAAAGRRGIGPGDRKSTRLNSSHGSISYAV